MTNNELFKLIDKLEVTVIKGIPIPLTNYTVVDGNKIINILDKIRASIKFN